MIRKINLQAVLDVLQLIKNDCVDQISSKYATN